MKRIWRAGLGALLLATLPAPSAAQETDPAELAEARAIVGVIFPPEERDQMMQGLIEQVAGQIEQAMPVDVGSLGDPELTALIKQYRAGMLDLIMPTVRAHLPNIIEATAVAYTREFDLAELRDIRAFAETPSGRRYLSRSTALISDPAVAEANTAYFRELQAVAAPYEAEFRQRMTSYLTEHPEVARKITAASRAR